VSLVGFVVVLALVGSSCGSESSSEAPQAAERWQLSLTSTDGQTLPNVKLKNGQQIPQLVVDGTYVVNATVPSSLRSELDGKTVELQHRAGADGEWKTVKEVNVGGDGRIREEFTAGKDLIHRHDFRVAVLPSGSSPTTKGAAAEGAAAGDVGVRLVSATQLAQVSNPEVAPPKVQTSDTTSAVGVVQFAVQLSNNTTHNLNIYVPTDASGSTYNEAEVSIAIGETKTLIYTNPVAGMLIHLRVNKDECLLGCTNYIADWSYHPVTKPKNSACSASMPKFVSNQTYKIDLNDGSGNAGFAAGSISGPIGGAGTDNTCYFRLDSEFVNWWQTSKVAGFIETAVAVAAITAVFVAFVIATDGAGTAATPEAAAAIEEEIAEGVVQEVEESSGDSSDEADTSIASGQGPIDPPVNYREALLEPGQEVEAEIVENGVSQDVRLQGLFHF